MATVSSEAVNKMATRKETNNDIQHTENQTLSNTKPTNKGSELICSGRVSSFYSTNDTLRITVKQNDHHLIRNLVWSPIYVNEYKQQYVDIYYEFSLLHIFSLVLHIFGKQTGYIFQSPKTIKT